MIRRVGFYGAERGVRLKTLRRVISAGAPVPASVLELAHFKVPRYVHFVDEFPLTVTGKVQKFVLREQLTELLEQESSAQLRTGV